MFQKRTSLTAAFVLVALSMMVARVRADDVGIGSIEVIGITDPSVAEKFRSELDRSLRDAGLVPVSLLMNRPCPDIGCWAGRARAQGAARFLLPMFEGYGSTGYVITVKVYDAKSSVSLFREKVEIPDIAQSELQLAKLATALLRQMGGGSNVQESAGPKRKGQVRILGLSPGRGVVLNNIPVADPTRPISVEPGRQRLVISAGDQAKSREFDVMAGELYTLEFTSLDSMAVTEQTGLPAMLELRNLPTDARVTLDDRVIPSKPQNEIPAGTHTVVIERQGYEKLDLIFTARPGQQVLLPVVMAPETAGGRNASTGGDRSLLSAVGLIPGGIVSDAELSVKVMDAARYAMEQSGKIRYQSPESLSSALSMKPAQLQAEVEKCVTGLCLSRLLKPANLARYVDVRVRKSGSNWIVKTTLFSAEQGHRVDGIEIPFSGSRSEIPWMVYDSVRQLIGDHDPVGMSRIRLLGANGKVSLSVRGQEVDLKPVGDRLETSDIGTGVVPVTISAENGEPVERVVYLRRETPYELDLALKDMDDAPATVRPAAAAPLPEPPPSPTVRSKRK